MVHPPPLDTPIAQIACAASDTYEDYDITKEMKKNKIKTESKILLPFAVRIANYQQLV